MAIVNTKSTTITNADSSPRTANSSYFADGEVRASSSFAAKAAGDSNGSVYRYFRVPSNCRIHSLRMLSAALAGATSADVGVYDPASLGGAVVSANALVSAADISAGKAVPTEMLGILPGNMEKRLWELLGLTADPYKEYDICVTLNTAGGAAGNIGLQLEYSL